MTGLFLESASSALRRRRTSTRLTGAAIPLLLCLSFPVHADWQALHALENSGAVVNASAVDLDSGEVLEQLNAADRLTPASLTKLAVAATALDVWPADKTFQTRLLGVGPFKDGRIDGDLVLQGMGDSTLDHLALWSLAAQLKGTGVTTINGRLVVNTAPFGPLGCETKDRCDALQRSDTAYNAPLSAVAVDYGNWCVDIRPTGIGSPAVVSTCGTAQAPIPVDGTIKTVGPAGKPTFWAERVTNASGEMLRVGGDIPLGGNISVYRAMSDPALGTGLMMREVLREIGIAVTGSVDVVHTPPPINAYPLAQNEGLSLKEQLGRMLRFSNNYVADMLTLNLAASQRSQAPGQLSDAARALSDYVRFRGRVQPVRREEIAASLARPLRQRYGLPAAASNDGVPIVHTLLRACRPAHDNREGVIHLLGLGIRLRGNRFIVFFGRPAIGSFFAKTNQTDALERVDVVVKLGGLFTEDVGNLLR
ncbi:MAG: D-alanyl-D-alanine carboxypeptidase, partial [Nevskiales bacterium]